MPVDNPFGFGASEIKQEGSVVKYDPGAVKTVDSTIIREETGEELAAYLKECADDDTYFEIDGRNSQILWEYVENLRLAAEDDRGVL